jgi:hypothetical protein
MRKKVDVPPPKDWMPRLKKVIKRFQRPGLGLDSVAWFCSYELL